MSQNDDNRSRPVNPLLSRFPLEMSADEARREGRRARRTAQRLPDGHPYAAAPPWVPLPAALAIEKVRLVIGRRQAAGPFRLRVKKPGSDETV